MRSLRLAVLGSIIPLCLALASLAVADDVTVRSTPNGDLRVDSNSSTSTNKDKDNDSDTLTQADRLNLLYAVFNNIDATQTVHITAVLDGPGTVRDATLADEDVVLGPRCTGGFCEDAAIDAFEFQIKRKDWPAGTYSLSVTASGSESATAVSTFTVASASNADRERCCEQAPA